MAGTVLRCLGTLALAILSMAQTWSSPNWRPVSGLTGDFSDFYTASEVHALNRLEFYEHADDSMLIKIWLEKLCHEPPCDPGPRDIEPPAAAGASGGPARPRRTSAPGRSCPPVTIITSSRSRSAPPMTTTCDGARS